MDVKERLRELMEERGWTIYRLAKEADIPWSTVRNMFKRNTEPSVTTLEALCRGMGITLSCFFDPDNTSGLTSEQAQLIHNWNRLREKDRKTICELVESLSERHGEDMAKIAEPIDSDSFHKDRKITNIIACSREERGG